LLIYLWNPLVVIETAHGAHVDVWMVLLTMAALWLWVRYGETGSETAYPWSGRTAAAVTLALATLTKIMPGLMVPVLFWRWKWRWLLVYGTTVAFFVIAAGMRAGWGLVGPLDGRGLFGALRIYGDQWNYNGGLFHWLEMWLWLCSGIPFGEGECLLWAKRIVTVLMMIGLGVVWLRARYITSARELIRICSVPLMLYLLLTTTVHPWYLLIVVAFLPFVAPGEDEPGRLWWWVVPWLYLSGALFLSYLTYLDLANLREYEWVRRTEWLPVLAMLAINSVMWFWQRKQSNNRAIG
jgi:alpha-1,6-mannosyltransferase